MKRFNIWLLFLLAALLILPVAGCKNDESTSRDAGTAEESPAPEATAQLVRKRPEVESGEVQFAQPAPGDTLAVIETSLGKITAVLYGQYAPMAVESFTGLAAQGAYDGCTFFRTEQDFIVQSGDPTNTGLGGQSLWGSPFAIERNNTLRHYAGALCLAAGIPAGGDESAQPVNGSQFYIVQCWPGSVDEAMAQKLREAGEREEVVEAYLQAGGAPYLDNTDTVFGQVIEGMDIVDKIASAALDEQGNPKDPVTIIRITIETVQ